jgi:hypothetical protein
MIAFRGRVCAVNQYSRAVLLECISVLFYLPWLLGKCPTAARTENVPIRQVQRSCVQLRLRRKSFEVPRPQILWYTCKGRDENHVHVCRVSMPRKSCSGTTLFGVSILLFMLVAMLLLPSLHEPHRGNWGAYVARYASFGGLLAG